MTVPQSTGRGKREPVPKDLRRFLAAVSAFHGPNRYDPARQPINGATALVDPGAEFDTTGRTGGSGSVHAWFVGSPSAFRFGFARTGGWAVRKMCAAMLEEKRLIDAEKVAS